MPYCSKPPPNNSSSIVLSVLGYLAEAFSSCPPAFPAARHFSCPLPICQVLSFSSFQLLQQMYGLPMQKPPTELCREQNRLMLENQFQSEQLFFMFTPSEAFGVAVPSSQGKSHAGHPILVNQTKPTCLSMMTISSSIWKHTR